MQEILLSNQVSSWEWANRMGETHGLQMEWLQIELPSGAFPSKSTDGFYFGNKLPIFPSSTVLLR